MGCIQSTEQVGNGSSPKPLETQNNGLKDPSKESKDGSGLSQDPSGGNASKKNSLNPSVTLQQLLARPNLADLSRAAAGEAHHLKNIFAIPLDKINFHTYKPPVYIKTEEEKEFIMEALKKNFVFESLHHKELFPLMQAFEKMTASPDEVIINEGDKGDFFYILQTGQCIYRKSGEDVGLAESGDSFGELALLYTCPRAATVVCKGESTLFRVDQTTFRYILQAKTEESEKTKVDLLQNVAFLKDASEEELAKLATAMTPRPFSEGEYLMRKSEPVNNFFLIQDGKVLMTNIDMGPDTESVNYEDVVLKSGDYGGEGCILWDRKRFADLIAQTDGMAFTIDKETFQKRLGSMEAVILRSMDMKKLSAIKVIKDSQLDRSSLTQMTNLISDRVYEEGQIIIKEGKWVEAELFLVRSGKVKVMTKIGDRDNTVGAGAFFGEDLLLADASANKNGPKDPSTALAAYTVTVLEKCCVGVLALKDCRKVVDTVGLGKPRKGVLDSLVERGVSLAELKRHDILGAGTFGQVWLVSRDASDGTKRPYALKVQSKYELCKAGQAKAVVYEKNIMAQLQNPFISRLVATYKDETFVYMLMGLVQGGELYSVIHTSRRDGMKEKHAVFYVAGVAEGLGYMHRRGFVYRDLKPENVLIDNLGYPVIVDFGFAKFVAEKTFTLCGTPLYLAPEVILNRGHNWAADHWSLGVLMFEIINGYTPFYKEGMDQMELFRAIVKCRYTIPSVNSQDAVRLLQGLLTKDPAKRLGSLAGSEEDILAEPWFKPIDMEKYRMQEIKAPYVPKVKDPLDSSNFEDWSHLDDKTKKKFPKLKPEQEKIFDNF